MVRRPDTGDAGERKPSADAAVTPPDPGPAPSTANDSGTTTALPDAGAASGDPNLLDPLARDVTFFVTSDTHIGRPEEDTDATKASMAMIAAMHAVKGAAFPEGLALGPVGAADGVVVTGDLTDDNQSEEWTQFDAIWGANGEGAVRYPVFEGWGNHDLHGSRPDVQKGMRARHQRRQHKTYVAEGDGAHYSWDWHDVHLVQLNLYPGMKGGLGLDSPDLYNPRNSLAFLAGDLAARVGKSGRPVILFFHFGLEENNNRGWASSEREAFYKVIDAYNVIGVFVGHSHAQRYEQVQSLAAGPSGRKIDMYVTDDTLSAASGRKTGFYVVHVGASEMVVAERTINGASPWGFVRKTSLKTP